MWWFGDGVGVMVFTPVYLAWSVPTRIEPGPIPFRPAVDVAMLLGGLAVLVAIVSAQGGALLGAHPRPSLLLPFVLYASIRLPFRYVTLLVMTLAQLFMTQAVARGSASSPYLALLAQEYALVVSIVALGLSALLQNVRLTEEELRDANAELRRRAGALEQSNRELQRIAYGSEARAAAPAPFVAVYDELAYARFPSVNGAARVPVRRLTPRTPARAPNLPTST